mgnify:CR=1 FL=1
MNIWKLSPLHSILVKSILILDTKKQDSIRTLHSILVKSIPCLTGQHKSFCLSLHSILVKSIRFSVLLYRILK